MKTTSGGSGMHQSFRKDIQGLRALAVLLVLAWHARVPGITRGYVGVDAFFVISGFLITGLLMNELRSTGRLNLVQFYARRMRRLLPASSVVIIVSVLLTLWLVPAIRWSSISGDALASGLYFQNWRLAGQAVDYLAHDAAAGPLQHYWSLAVEEQFYLVWPLLIVLVTRPRFANGGLPLRRVGICVVVVFVASLAWSVHYTQLWPGPAYFAATTRGWEFALGAGLSVVMSRKRSSSLSSKFSAAIGWVGLALLVGSAVYLPERFPFPGFIALVPTLGTVAVIASGASAGRFGPQVLLDRRPTVFVGTISYSLYLWHWPLLVVLGARFGPLGVSQSIAIVVASAVPAYLTFRYVETPARRLVWFSSARRGLALGVACTVIAVSSAITLGVLSPEPTKISAARQAELDAIEQSLSSTSSTNPSASPTAPTTTAAAVTTAGLGALSLDEPGEQESFEQPATVAEITPDPFGAAQDVGAYFCRQEIESSAVLNCEFGDLNSDVEIALVGDSHAAQWTSAFVAIADARGWKVVVYSKAACTYTGLRLALEGQEYSSCTAWNAEVHRLLLERRPSVIVVTGRDKPVLSDDVVVPATQALALLVSDQVLRWGDLIANGSQVIALADTPIPGFYVPECVSTHRDDLAACTFESATALQPEGGSLRATARELPSVHYVDLNPAICPGAVCPVVVGGVLVYSDRTHLTDTYVQTLTPTLASALQSIV
ncbi:MAG: acyltransferase family protein [Ilumatobacteraceae bacterium]